MIRTATTLFAALLLMDPADVHAQNCATPPPTAWEYAHVRDVIAHIDVSALRNEGTTCVPMQANVVRTSSGTGGITQAELNEALTFVNYAFHNAGIEFFWKGPMSTANNSDFYTFDDAAGDNDTEAGLVALFTPATDAINIYFTGGLGGPCGWAYYPSPSASSNRIIMSKACALTGPSGTFPHEMGHYLGLFHTFEGTEDGPTSFNAEHVPRTGPQSNCTTDGDLLCGTEADPNGSTNVECEYTGGGTDIYGNPYDPPLLNIMSYYPCSSWNGFTDDQFTRAAQGLVQRMSYTAYTLDAPPQNVEAPNGLSATLDSLGAQLIWTDNADNELGYLVERSSTSATEGFRQLAYGSSGANSTSYDDHTLASNTTYYYRVKSVNGDCNAYGNVDSVTTGILYCTPFYLLACSPIDNFIFIGDAASINNLGSGCSPNEYGDFTALSADVSAGNTYFVTASEELNYACYIQMWGDWNQDGDFNDADETMLPSYSQMEPVFHGTITVPPNAPSGTTRFRVRVWNQSSGGNISPCGQRIFGEGEDYTLLVSGEEEIVRVSARIWLESPFVDGTPPLMRDNLRVSGLIPLNEPYSALGYGNAATGGGESTSAEAFEPTGSNAIVDWVRVELRDSNDPSQLVASRHGLVQRDGHVVSATDGVRAVTLHAPAGNYYVVVRHRTHLGCMTAEPLALSADSTIINLITAAVPAYGTDARKALGPNRRALWAGDVNADHLIQYTGSGNDRDAILNAIGGNVPTATLSGEYRQEDVNMNSTVKYTGTNNDRDIILLNVGGVPAGTRAEQVP